MTIMNRIMNFFGVQEEEEHIDDMQLDSSALKGKNNVVTLHSQKNVRLVLFEPRTFEESQEIADSLKNYRPVIVNLQRVRRETGTKIIDFLSGTVYALGGNIQKLGPHIFTCTPANVDIQGNITDILQEES